MDVNWARQKTTANFVVILLRHLHSNYRRGIRRVQIGANNNFLPCMADDDALAPEGSRVGVPSYLTLHFCGRTGPGSELWRQDDRRFEGKGKECRDTEEGECD